MKEVQSNLSRLAGVKCQLDSCQNTHVRTLSWAHKLPPLSGDFIFCLFSFQSLCLLEQTWNTANGRRTQTELAPRHNSTILKRRKQINIIKSTPQYNTQNEIEWEGGKGDREKMELSSIRKQEDIIYCNPVQSQSGQGQTKYKLLLAAIRQRTGRGIVYPFVKYTQHFSINSTLDLP